MFISVAGSFYNNASLIFQETNFKLSSNNYINVSNNVSPAADTAASVCLITADMSRQTMQLKASHN